jgi:hypothetical protein
MCAVHSTCDVTYPGLAGSRFRAREMPVVLWVTLTGLGFHRMELLRRAPYRGRPSMHSFLSVMHRFDVLGGKAQILRFTSPFEYPPAESASSPDPAGAGPGMGRAGQ